MRFEVKRLAAAGVLLISTVIAAVVTQAGGVAVGTSVEISRFTIDAGGSMISAGGGFELSGTIGQPDAGELGGGELTLSGGFWFGQSPCDCNEDGGINLFDYRDFDSCASGSGGGLLAPFCACFDLDADQDVDLEDYGEFQRLFSGS